DAAWECVKALDEPACVIVKHANPCGVAQADNLVAAYEGAYACDPSSAFGGIIAFNRELDEHTAGVVTQQFVEVLLAPSVSAAAREVLHGKLNVRVLEVPLSSGSNRYDMQRVGGGLLLQTPDVLGDEASGFHVVSKRAPTSEEMRDLLFAWRV